MDSVRRCQWAGMDDPRYLDYHDKEWGVPVHDDKVLFEFLVLEGAQAGLSWSTILKKRQNYRKAFDRFDPARVARYDAKKVRALLQDAGIVRNRLKIRAAIANAKAFLTIQQEFGSFDKYLWSFVGGKQVRHAYRSLKELPPKTELSDRISDDLKRRGMTFVGSTIIYAFLQAVGVVNDHQVNCFRYRQEK